MGGDPWADEGIVVEADELRMYLQQHRINNAARMLTETSKSVTEIGSDCGFSSPNYFSMAFRDMIGVSPREFRKG